MNKEIINKYWPKITVGSRKQKKKVFGTKNRPTKFSINVIKILINQEKRMNGMTEVSDNPWGDLIKTIASCYPKMASKPFVVFSMKEEEKNI